MADREASFIMRLIDMVSGPAKSIGEATGAATGKIMGMTGALGTLGGKAFAFNQISQSIQTVGQELNAAVQPGIAFDTSMKELQAVTGVSGSALDELGQRAREQAKTFGGDAAGALNSYNALINRLGPGIASNSTALASMGTNVAVLSKSMKGDGAGAAQALSTSLLQFGVNLKDPILAARTMTEYTNVMVAGMNAGSMDVPKISQALEAAGSTARKAGLSFKETNAALQTIALSGRMGAEAGVGLRNVLVKMTSVDILPKAVQDKLRGLHVNMKLVTDTSQPLSVRLTELKKIQKDASLTTQMFGEENKVVADTLLDNIGYYKDMLPQLNNHTAATDAARVIMSSYEERMSRAGARVRDMGISLFNATKDYLPFIQGSVQVLDTTARLGPAFSTAKGGVMGLVGSFRTAENGTKGMGLQLVQMGWNAIKAGAALAFTGITAVGSFVTGLLTATLAQYGLNTAMLANPVGLFIVGMVAIGAAIALVIHYWDDLKGYIMGFGKWLFEYSPFGMLWNVVDTLFPALKQSILGVFDDIVNNVTKIWNWLGDKLSGFKKFFGGLFGGGAIVLPKDPYAGMGPPPPPPPPGPNTNTATGGLNKPKGTDIEGDKSKARVVNVRIDKIEVINKIAGAVGRNLDDLGRGVASVIVGAVRDAEIVLSIGS